MRLPRMLKAPWRVGDEYLNGIYSREFGRISEHNRSERCIPWWAKTYRAAYFQIAYHERREKSILD